RSDRRRAGSHRCEPRNPAPLLTRTRSASIGALLPVRAPADDLDDLHHGMERGPAVARGHAGEREAERGRCGVQVEPDRDWTGAKRDRRAWRDQRVVDVNRSGAVPAVVAWHEDVDRAVTAGWAAQRLARDRD